MHPVTAIITITIHHSLSHHHQQHHPLLPVTATTTYHSIYTHRPPSPVITHSYHSPSYSKTSPITTQDALFSPVTTRAPLITSLRCPSPST
ncbi:hypothetical protein E2C01_082020 [Portunus trituberculatus]|uniref:Uncharacterized protein n=1 Tax=Portunus trituberculatus TaxID=210409 RepID=A0A5B7J2P1_PORTR|nr:hypothetical protein [Portunus trituberculatus]